MCLLMGKGWHVVACPSRALVVLYRMFTTFACYVFDFYVWDAVSTFYHLPRMFLSTECAFRIEHVAKDRIYMLY